MCSLSCSKTCLYSGCRLAHCIVCAPPKLSCKHHHHETSNERESNQKLKTCKSRELRGGILLTMCDCTKRNGLQDNCRRNDCMGKPACLTKPEPSCCPAQLNKRYENLQNENRPNTKCREKKEKDIKKCPKSQEISTETRVKSGTQSKNYYHHPYFRHHRIPRQSSHISIECPYNNKRMWYCTVDKNEKKDEQSFNLENLEKESKTTSDIEEPDQGEPDNSINVNKNGKHKHRHKHCHHHHRHNHHKHHKHGHNQYGHQNDCHHDKGIHGYHQEDQHISYRTQPEKLTDSILHRYLQPYNQYDYFRSQQISDDEYYLIGT